MNNLANHTTHSYSQEDIKQILQLAIACQVYDTDKEF